MPRLFLPRQFAAIDQSARNAEIALKYNNYFNLEKPLVAEAVTSMAGQIRIALIDDHPLFRDGVRQTLISAGDIAVVAEGGSAEEAIHIAGTAAPDVMLIDISMPGGGIAAAATIGNLHPEVKIVLLTVSESESDVSAAMTTGARGYVLKGISGTELVQIVRAVDSGQSYVAPALAAVMLRKLRQPEPQFAEVLPGEQLTAREDQILCQVAQGLTNKEIARNLNISEKTVKHYMTLIMQKLQVRNRVEAVLRRQRGQ